MPMYDELEGMWNLWNIIRDYPNNGRRDWRRPL